MAAPTYTGVQGNGGASASATSVATGSITTTTGNILVCFVFWDDGFTSTITSVTGGGTGITWTTKINKFTDTRHGQACQVLIGTGYTGASGAVTANFTPSTPFTAISVVEVSGQHATQFDATATDVADAGTAVDVGITTTQADCLVIGAIYDDAGSNTISTPAGMSSINNFSAGGQAVATFYRTSAPGAGATTVDFTLSGTDDVIGAAVAVAPAVSGGTSAPFAPRAMTMGIG